MFYITSLSEFCASNKIDDAKRDEGLTTPEGVLRFDDIRYGEHERNVLDVYRPKDRDGALPVIVSIHGGGWVYGDKGINQFYCMSLAEQGFAVVNYSYRLAPDYKHPVPLEDANKVFHWVLENAETYGFDTDNIFGVGDSCGANILGFYCCLCVDPAYAEKWTSTRRRASCRGRSPSTAGFTALCAGRSCCWTSLRRRISPTAARTRNTPRSTSARM